MGRLIVASAFGAAVLMSSAVFAQVPADPNNPNKNLPDARTPAAFGETTKIKNPKKAAAAGIAEAQKRNWNALCIAIVGPSGDLVYFEKQDNCQYASTGISQKKAPAGARYRRPTLVFERLLGKGDFFAYLPTLGNDFIASRGGNPLVVGGKIVGA